MRGLLFLLIFTICASCSPPATGEKVTLVIGAAASTSEVMNELAGNFMALNPKLSIRFNFAASGTLLSQLSQGAPLDGFIFANRDIAKRAAAYGKGEIPVKKLFMNRLFLVARDGKGIKGSLASIDRFAIGNPEYVPLGSYSVSSLKAGGLWSDLKNRLVYGGNAAQVKEYLRRGEVDGAVVYGSDLAGLGDDVEVIADLSPYGTPEYFGVSLKPDGEMVGKFFSYLKSGDGSRTLEEHGFIVEEGVLP